MEANKIAVWVTAEEREELEFLVNRRIGDLEHLLHMEKRGIVLGSIREQLEKLYPIKHKLQHAGT